MTFLLSEDNAIRDLMKGMVVTDQKSNSAGPTTRNVSVYFGQPDQEIRAQAYPYITIDMIDIAEDFARSMRGMVKPMYMSDPTNMVEATNTDPAVPYDPTTNDWSIHWPIPVNIDYQITTYARQPRHDREILAQIMYTKIPLRFAILEPDDNTVRRLDVLDISKRDVTEQGKRLFVNAFTVRVSSEIAPETYNNVYKALELTVSGTEGTFVQGSTSYPFTAVDTFTKSAQ
jgi:hypothetical protein